MDWQKIHLCKVSAGLERGAGYLSERRHGSWIELDYEGAKVLYSSGYRQRFDLTW